METTEHLIARLTRERDEAIASAADTRAAEAQRALIAADRLLGAYGLPWWISLESTLRVVASSWALRDHQVGPRALENAMGYVQAQLSRIDATLQERR